MGGCDLNVKDKDGQTALHFVACEGHTEIASILIEAGCDLNVQDKEGETALHFAARDGHAEIASLLIEAGADLHLQDKDGKTPSDVTTEPQVRQIFRAKFSALIAAVLPAEWELQAETFADIVGSFICG